MNASVDVQDVLIAANPLQQQHFQGQIIASKDLKHHNLSNKRVAVIGADQYSVKLLHTLTLQAAELFVFQIEPHLILPQSTRITSTLIPQPLIARNRRLFSQRIKRVLALRFLEREVTDIWLRRLLTANAASSTAVFLKSDSYYQALQKDNCQLISWPIAQICSEKIITIQGLSYPIDVLVYTNDEI